MDHLQDNTALDGQKNANAHIGWHPGTFSQTQQGHALRWRGSKVESTSIGPFRAGLGFGASCTKQTPCLP
jgi:hypothetical protein